MGRRAIGVTLLVSALLACQHRSQVDPRVNGEVVQLDRPPPALTGTVTVLGDGVTGVVADPDRDRVLVVDLAGRTITRELTLPDGSLPGRAAEDGGGRVHVALRGTGELFSFDPRSTTDDGERRRACAMPRGVAYDPGADRVLVACRGGELVELPTSGEAATRTLQVTGDLRDVIVVSGRRFVTTFREARLLEIAADGTVLSDRAPLPTQMRGASGSVETYGASVAWRAVVTPDGAAIAMVHQRGRSSSISVNGTVARGGGYGAPTTTSTTTPVTCASSVVHGAVSIFDLDGAPARAGGAIVRAVLPVDVAVSGATITLVAAGNQAGHDAYFDATESTLTATAGRDGCAVIAHGESASTSTAVAYDGAGELVRLERDPAVLVVGADRIELGGASVFDTGHALFHANLGTQVACASCHPEGGEDGRVWTFDGVPRRTQTLAGGVSATAPLHWDGGDADMAAIVEDVMVGRMHGARLTAAQTTAFGAWIDAIPAAHGETRDALAAERGRVLFEGRAGCSDCHGGAHFTSNASATVGTSSEPLQIPSLVGVSLRTPLMRSGCATSLAQRFSDVRCGGGTLHGQASALAPSELTDLIAYLESL